MNHLVKILSNDDGDKISDPVWCLVHQICGGNATLCKGEYFGFGESGCVYEIKKVKKGGITCLQCLEIIKKIKAVKL
jgi:hypothetical protein